MVSKVFIFACLQALLLKEAFTLPLINGGSTTPMVTGVTNSVITGSASQAVLPGPSANWQGSAQAVPLITEIMPNLSFGEMNVDGEMPVRGLIMVSGTFPVFGNVAVDGTVPSYGTAYVDTANVFNDCGC